MAKSQDKLNQELFTAVKNGDIDAIKALFNNDIKPNVNAQDEDKSTALHHATLRGNINVIKALIQAGAQVDAQDEYRRQPIHYAALGGNVEIIKELIKAGANKVNIIDADGWQPIHYAAKNGNLDAMKVLVIAGANINAKTKDNETIFDINSKLDTKEIESYSSRKSLLKTGFGLSILATILGVAGIVAGIALSFTIGLSMPIFAGIITAAAIVTLGSAYMIGASKHGLNQLKQGNISQHWENLCWVTEICQNRTKAPSQEV